MGMPVLCPAKGSLSVASRYIFQGSLAYLSGALRSATRSPPDLYLHPCSELQREPLAVPAATANPHRNDRMAQIARNTADKATTAAKNATANVAEAGKRTSDKTAEVMRETAGQAANAVRDGLRVVRQSADAAAEVEQKTVSRAGAGMAELNRGLLDLSTSRPATTSSWSRRWPSRPSRARPPSCRASSCVPASSGRLSSPSAMSRSARPS